MAKRKSNSAYYYAGNERITLTPNEDLVAIDTAYCADQLDASTLGLVQRTGRPIGSGIVLMERHDLSAGVLSQLQTAGFTQPVFEREGTAMIALPEIRIESDSIQKLSKVVRFVRERAFQIDDRQASGRISVTPASHDARESLELANEIVEHFRPISVSPRFLRIVPGPTIRNEKR